MTYQIYVSNFYGGDWRFYDSAYDSNGNMLETTVISREVFHCGSSRCTYIEQVGLKITRNYLEDNKKSGIRFKLTGKAGEEVFFIPGEYIKAIISLSN